MEFKQLSFLVLGAFALAIIIVALTSADFSKIGLGSLTPSANCVGVMHITGDIVSGDSPDPVPGSTTPGQVEASIQQAEGDSDVGSILMVVDSPGGSAAASKEIYDEIRASNKPVVAYLSEVAASGGYYAASASTYIVANPDTITANIGARTELISYEDLLAKLGVQDYGITTGQYKDIGAPYRNATPEEQQMLLGLLEESFTVFKDDVQAGRGSRLNQTAFAQVLDGRPLGAREALQVGLIDSIGDRSDAVDKAADIGNVSFTAGTPPTECDLDPQPSLEDYLSQLSLSFGQGIASAFTAPTPSLQYKFGS
jgi:protease-4